MKRAALIIFCMISAGYSLAQECPSPVLTSPGPTNGAMNVPVTATIYWESVTGVPAYLISLGTTPGGTEIVDEVSVGSDTSYTPPLGLPSNTEVYVTITLFFFQGGISPIRCSSESFTTETITTPPPCTTMRIPVDGATDVNIGTNISWDNAPTATGYRLTLGTTSGGIEILDNQDLGNVLFYNPPADLPPNTTIYVRITPYNANGDLDPCPEQQFTTGDVATIPGCTSLTSPTNGAINVPLTPNLEWTAVAEATGYRVTIGSSPFTAEVLDNVEFSTNSTLVLNFEPNTNYFILIVPFNNAGDAIGCLQESFSTILGCGPFFDPMTGELVTLNPEIDFPELFSFCSDELPLSITSEDSAEGYRWYAIDSFGIESLISTSADVVIENTGQYRYEAFNTVEQSGASIECVSEQNFEVTISGPAIITDINLSEEGNGTRIEVEIQGPGDYEYALDSSDGPYQDSNVFSTSTELLYTIYVRDKNGCGITEETIEQDLTLDGFPKFFTPNGDGINDFWQYIPPESLSQNPLEVIYIFDRFGNLLVQIDPISQGWDGNFNGSPLPSSDYWFKARSINNSEIRGHFALKR